MRIKWKDKKKFKTKKYLMDGENRIVSYIYTHTRLSFYRI